jgi:hypothetical protein
MLPCIHLANLFCIFGVSRCVFGQVKKADSADAKYEKFHHVLSLLSYLLKAPMVPAGTPVVNALAAQRQVS